MRKLLFLLIIIHISLVEVLGQTLTAREWNEIQKSGNYYVGMGMSESLEHARLVALNDLTGKISVQVKSRFEFVLKNKDNSQSEAQMDKIIRTYSSMKLNNVLEHIVKDHDKYVVYRYIKKSDFRAMHMRRMNIARNLIEEAVRQEKEGKIGDALQNFYWSQALLRSCPDGDLDSISIDSTKYSMLLDTKRRVDSIMNHVSIKAIATEKEGYSQRLTLEVKYKGGPAVNFNYKYKNGNHFTKTYSVKDGLGELLLPPNGNMKKLNVYAEYHFADEANIIPELSNVLASLDPVPFNEYVIPVDTKNCPVIANADYVMIGEGTPVIASPTASLASEAMKAIAEGLSLKDYKGLDAYFTSRGWEMFERLVGYGNARLLRSQGLQFFTSGSGVVCRSIPMSFTFDSNHRSFTEDVVFYFDHIGKIDEVAFALEKAAVDDIMNRGNWDVNARQVMVHFLETYKTAYALKRLDYINSIFSRNALIITGSMVKGTKQKELTPAKVEHVKYTRQTKEQYMKNLERCFKSNEYINLHFADNIVRRSHSNNNIYGIQIKQEYFSSTYGDTGYLFLLLDFAKPETPIIHVRTWQPDDNPNVKDGRIGLADFTGLEQL